MELVSRSAHRSTALLQRHQAKEISVTGILFLISIQPSSKPHRAYGRFYCSMGGSSIVSRLCMLRISFFTH